MDEVVSQEVVNTAPVAEPAPEATPEVAPEAAPQVATEAAPAAPAEQPQAQPEPAEEPVGNRYEKSLEALMQRARDTRRQQQEQERQQAQLDFAQRIAQAQQYGPEAVKKVLGIEDKKLDLRDILGEEDDGEPPTVKELKRKVNELEGFIKQEQQAATQRQQQERQAQMTAWERSEMGKIESFVNENKDKYEFTAELAPIGSTRDLYNGIINMYQAGYTPSYNDMAELVENRVEDILDRLAHTKKFQAWAAKKLKPQSSAPAQPKPTLTGALTADSVAQVPPDNESDEENRKRALQAAYAAREAALKKIKEVENKG